jgi:hypothetical protein
LKGYTLGRDYGNFGPKQRDLTVLVLSPSMVPGTVLDGAINAAFKDNEALKRNTSTGGQGSGQKLGLPVQAHPYSDVCKRVMGQITDSITSLLGLPGWAGKFIKKVVQAAGKFRYCNSLGYHGSYTDLTEVGDVAKNAGNQIKDANAAIGKANDGIRADNAKLPAGGTPKAEIPTMDTSTGGGALSSLDPALDEWWGHDGPLYPWDGTSNGSPWQEVWSMNLKPEYADKQEHAVAIGQRKFGQTATNKEAFGYFAEAEFYFDCKKGWEDDSCNGKDANAAYSVQWRARLRRLEFPAIGTLLGSYIGNFVANLASIEEFVRDKKFEAIGKALPLGKISKVVGPVINAAFDALKEKAQALAAKVGGLANPGGLSGSYH